MTIVLSGNLRRYADFECEVEVDAESISAAIAGLILQHPDLAPVVQDGEGKLRAVHRLYLNGQILSAEESDRALHSNDELGILTAIAGG